MQNVAIVILNYLNYTDTIECVDSILQNAYDICGIVIVENGSGNQSVKAIKKAFKNKPGIYILQSDHNAGFAKGNNIGIKYARRILKADYVLVVNNDTIFTDKDFINKLTRHDEDTGLLGSRIIVNKNKIQDIMRVYLSFPDILIYYFYIACLFFNWETIAYMIREKILHEKRRVPVLHGCVLMFTPRFFSSYEGFYPHTFLYCEEYILELMLNKAGMKHQYVKEAFLFHKEDKSSELSFQNKTKTKLRYSLRSYLHVLLVRLLPYNILKNIVN